MTKKKPWGTGSGMMVGLALGVLIWLSAYEPSAGLFQNPQLIIVPAVLGLGVVSLRNRWKKAGPYDPEIIERNKTGVV